jgi:hypothetical protein
LGLDQGYELVALLVATLTGSYSFTCWGSQGVCSSATGGAWSGLNEESATEGGPDSNWGVVGPKGELWPVDRRNELELGVGESVRRSCWCCGMYGWL